MIYWLLFELGIDPRFTNVFKYQSFRSGLAALTAFIFVIFLGPKFIARMKAKQFGQAIRSDGPKSHLKKTGTPTMGGLLIIGALVFSTLLWGDLSNHYLIAILFLSIAFTAIGFLDDYLKVIRKDPKGLASRWKFLLQIVFALMTAIAIQFVQEGWSGQGILYFPFLKDFTLNIGLWYIGLTTLVIVASSNAVNLTDGLDGLAIGPCIVCCASFFLLTYLGGNLKFSDYLQIPYVPQLGELTVFCSAALGGAIAFLWFNSYPAEIFMGDVGSLSLGAILGTLAVLSKNELLFIILGGIFVFETVSVILQVASFKLTGKRIFRMAPIHHHFELKGWSEPKVIVRFWIISFALAVIALSTLKLR